METKSTDVSQIQQGDVGLERVIKVPTGAKRLPHRTVAKGEATGHHHTFVEESVELYERDGVLYVSAPEGATLKHQTHNPVTVPPGTWVYRPRREQDHLGEVVRRVMD